MDINQLKQHVDELFTPEVARFFVGAARQAYRHRDTVRMGYANPAFGVFTAGNAVSSHLNDIVFDQLGNRVPGAQALVSRDRSPHPELLIRIGDLLITMAALPLIPSYASIPHPTKRRLRRAWESGVLPQQRSLFYDDPITNVDAGDYIFGLIVHSSDSMHPSTLASMSLCVVDQLYQLALPPIDVIGRSQVAAQSLDVVDAIRPLDIAIKRDGTSSAPV